MKKLTNYFLKKNILFQKIYKIDLKTLNTRKKLEIYSALDIKNSYYAIFVINSKSRFVTKNAEDLILLLNKLITTEDHNFKKKTLLISSVVCSKAKLLLENHNWSVKNDFM